MKFRRGTKYHNKKCDYNGITFDSILERDRYIVLSDFLSKGIIKDLELQVEMELMPRTCYRVMDYAKKTSKMVKKTFRPVKYIADFVYVKDGEKVVEDTKGVKTKEFKIKEKIFYQKFGFPIRIVKKASEPV